MTRFTIPRARRTLYKSVRLLGDVQAVRRGRIPQRAVNRALGRGVAKVLRGVWR